MLNAVLDGCHGAVCGIGCSALWGGVDKGRVARCFPGATTVAEKVKARLDQARATGLLPPKETEAEFEDVTGSGVPSAISSSKEPVRLMPFKVVREGPHRRSRGGAIR
jgi:Na+-translocating ferredoxin:NAD+ oxidoreductase RNF subunit RnfB